LSTPIADVVRPYGEAGLVAIADDAKGFASALDGFSRMDPNWLSRVDGFLANQSWDETWARMQALIEKAGAAAPASDVAREPAYV
jgi:hypothetical protein